MGGGLGLTMFTNLLNELITWVPPPSCILLLGIQFRLFLTPWLQGGGMAPRAPGHRGLPLRPLLHRHVLQVGESLPPAEEGHPPPQGHEQEEGKG